MIKSLTKYSSEVKAELHKATWPWDPKEKGVKKYKELIDSTVVVLIAMILLGGYVAFADLVLMNVMDLLLKGL
ncbi:MAG: preprotein translocase subunit SecE [Verrucomicrobiota bacterium]